MTNSRNKGAAFERAIAAELFAELGMKFSRNLRQYQERDHGDLNCDDPDFPFSLELKRYASGTECKPAWEVQAFAAAKKADKLPAVIWKYDRQPIRVRIWFDAMSEAFGVMPVVAGGKADLSLQDFCWIAREIMARRAS